MCFFYPTGSNINPPSGSARPGVFPRRRRLTSGRPGVPWAPGPVDPSGSRETASQELSLSPVTAEKSVAPLTPRNTLVRSTSSTHAQPPQLRCVLRTRGTRSGSGSLSRSGVWKGRRPLLVSGGGAAGTGRPRPAAHPELRVPVRTPKGQVQGFQVSSATSLI